MVSDYRFIFAVASCVVFLSSCQKEEKPSEYLSIDAITTNNLIKEVIDEINNNYADEVTREKLEEGAINGMLAFLDEHSVYINQEDFDAFNRATRGAFLGIGVEIKQIRDGIEVSSIIDESPACKSGLKVGDIITEIDGKDAVKMSMKEIFSRLSSDTAMKVSINIIRNKTEKFEITLKKSVIELKSIKTEFIDDIAVIKVNYFNEGTTESSKKFLKNALKKKITGLIIDLRNNPGGILDQAISFCELFLTDSKIVEFRARNDESRSVFAEGMDILDGLPIVVLIDKNTASGAELAAAALGENKRAVIAGEPSYGKGSLQTVIPIPGRGAIKLTTAYLFSPKGNSINQNGVLPDIVIDHEDDDSGDKLIQRALDLLRGLSALNEEKNNK